MKRWNNKQKKTKKQKKKKKKKPKAHFRLSFADLFPSKHCVQPSTKSDQLSSLDLKHSQQKPHPGELCHSTRYFSKPVVGHRHWPPTQASSTVSTGTPVAHPQSRSQPVSSQSVSSQLTSNPRPLPPVPHKPFSG